jgi:hypothetical protein
MWRRFFVCSEGSLLNQQSIVVSALLDFPVVVIVGALLDFPVLLAVLWLGEVN